MTADTTLDIRSLREEATDQLGAVVELRRTLHRWPEVGNELPLTREHVLGAIDGLPVDVTRHESISIPSPLPLMHVGGMNM